MMAFFQAVETGQNTERRNRKNCPLVKRDDVSRKPWLISMYLTREIAAARVKADVCKVLCCHCFCLANIRKVWALKMICDCEELMRYSMSNWEEEKKSGRWIFWCTSYIHNYYKFSHLYYHRLIICDHFSNSHKC